MERECHIPRPTSIATSDALRCALIRILVTFRSFFRSQSCRSSAPHFGSCFFFERLDYGGGVLFSEAKRNGGCEIFFGNAQCWNGGLQTFTKFFNEGRVLVHELECKAGRKIAFQNILSVAHEEW